MNRAARAAALTVALALALFSGCGGESSASSAVSSESETAISESSGASDSRPETESSVPDLSSEATIPPDPPSSSSTAAEESSAAQSTVSESSPASGSSVPDTAPAGQAQPSSSASGNTVTVTQPSQQSAQPSPSGYYQWTSGSAPAYVSALFDSINSYRAANGLSQLGYISEIQSEADLRAYEASVNWSHTRPDGRANRTVLDDMGITNYHAFGENLAKFDSSYEVTHALSLWEESPTHNENLLRDTFTGMCIGVCDSGGTTYCALLLVG